MPTPNSFMWATALTKKETTFGGGFATDPVYADWLVGLAADFVQEDWTYSDNNAEINGSVGAPTEHTLEMKQGALQRELITSPEGLTAFLAWALGQVTTVGASDPYTHTIKWATPCAVNPPSFSFIELLNCAGSTATYFKYKGATVESIAVELSSKGYIKTTVNIKTDGSETADATFTPPTSPVTVKRLLGNMATIKYGPAGTETVANIRNIKFTINLALIIPPDISANVLVPQFQYGADHPTIEVEFTVQGDKSHVIYGYATSGSKQILNITIDAGVTPSRSVQLTMSQTICTALVKAAGPETQLTVKVMAESNATDGTATNPAPAKFTCKNGNPSYLTAA